MAPIRFAILTGNIYIYITYIYYLIFIWNISSKNL